jgi:hypothetical protein
VSSKCPPAIFVEKGIPFAKGMPFFCSNGKMLDIAFMLWSHGVIIGYYNSSKATSMRKV